MNGRPFSYKRPFSNFDGWAVAEVPEFPHKTDYFVVSAENMVALDPMVTPTITATLEPDKVITATIVPDKVVTATLEPNRTVTATLEPQKTLTATMGGGVGGGTSAKPQAQEAKTFDSKKIALAALVAVLVIFYFFKKKK